MNLRLGRIAAGICLLWGLSPAAEARIWRPAQIPNGNIFECQTCHVNANPNINGARNAFGMQVEMFVTPGGTQTFWPQVRAMNADGDAFTNGQELQDLNNTFNGDFSDPPPPLGNPSCVSHPANASSTPPGSCLPSPTPAPTPTPSRTPTATPSRTPTPTPSPSPNPSPTATGFIDVTASPSRSPTATPSRTPTATPTAAPCCPGDADNSGGSVNANDFLSVQANFGANNGPGGMGDADCSGGAVNANDFLEVQAKFGLSCD